MATNKNITMRQYNGVDYDTLYPKTIASQIDDVYSKDEMSNLFLPKAGGSMGGILDMNGNRITNLPTPTSNSDPATKEYVDGIAGFEKIAEDSGSFSQTNSTGIVKPTNLLYSTFFEKLTQYLIRFHINGTIKFNGDQATANPLIMLFFGSNLSSKHGMAFNEGFTSKITKTVDLTKVYQYTSSKCHWNDGKSIYHYFSGLYDNSPYGTQLESSYLSLDSKNDSNDKLTISTISDSSNRFTMNINYNIEIYRLKI